MKRSEGFTLIELMIVVAIIGVLAAVAVPRFAEQIERSKEGATKGSLAAMRSALHIYYAGHEGRYPVSDSVLGSLGCLLDNPLYLGVMPVVKLPRTGVADSNEVKAVVADGMTQPDNAGGWFYYDDPSDNTAWGSVVVNCTKEDIKNNSLTLAGTPGHTYTAWSTF